MRKCGVFSPFFVLFAVFAAHFLMLNAMAKKAKSIVTLSLPKWRNRLYAMLNFICPNTASDSMGLFDRCSSPCSDVSLSRALRLYSFSRWLVSISRCQIQALNNRVDQANGVVLGNILVDSLRKKNRLVVYMRTKVYLCRHFYLKF